MAERVFVALDLETTGLDSARDSIIEIGAVRFQGDRILDRFSTLVNPLRPIPLRITQITGIRTADVAGAPVIDQVLPELLAFAGGDVAALIAHNAAFDLGFLRAAGVNFRRPVYDTLDLASILLPGMDSYSLGELCAAFDILLVDAHRALDDAQASGHLFRVLQAYARALPQATLRLIEAGASGAAEWPYRQFFADAAEEQEAAPVAEPPLAAGPLAEDWLPVELDSDESPTTVPAETVDALFAEGGPLAGLMGASFERRAGQVAMSLQVLQALNSGDHLLVEAGTGTGKSLAYLLPAALWAVANRRRVVIATNTITLQDQLIEKDIPQLQALMAAAGFEVPRAALLKGRQNYLCLRRLHAWRTGHRLSAQELTLLAKVLVWLPQTATGDAGELAMFATHERAIWARICSDAATCSTERCGEWRVASGENRTSAESAMGLTMRDFYLEARQRAESAHLLVVNHALLLADLAAEGRVLPGYAHVIVDETHRLEEAATDQLTFRVEWPAVQALLRRLAPEGDLTAQLQRAASDRRQHTVVEQLPVVAVQAQHTGRALTDFADRLVSFARNHDDLRLDAGYAQRLGLNGAVRSQPDWSQVEAEWDEVGKRLGNLVEEVGQLVNYLDEAQWWQAEPLAALFGDTRGAQETLSELARQLDDILLAPEGKRRDRVAWMEVTDGRTVTLAIAPLAVHDLLERGLVHQRRSAIFTGATLRTGSGFRFIRERLGLWDVTISTVDSPFDYKHSTLLYLPSDMPLPTLPNYQPMVEEAIIEAARAVDGRILVLFTSYQQLRTTADAIRAPLDRMGITVLQHGQGSRQRLLREYRRAGRAVLLGTRSFWEGVDLPGEELSCLLIARLPFAVPNDPLVAARSAEFDDPFHDYTVPDAVLRFRQGFGRLIRRATDSGAVVVLDSRMWRKDYGHAFLEALPECTVRRAPLNNLGNEIKGWLKENRPVSGL